MKIKCPDNLAGQAGEIAGVLFDEHGVSEDLSAQRARAFLSVFGGTLLDELPEGVPNLDVAVVAERRQKEIEAADEFYERMKFRRDLEKPSSDPSAPVVTEPVGAYTRDSLSALADKKGIKALREVGDSFGVRSNSIAKLIDDILEAQAKAALQSE